ncbi:MAG: hypothetical protein GF346_09410, partial [Candidatus Eisenbacteria bacterium]|nr:hypothetical protein [Candidatus Latescibacterota bacterium]MBD3302649.1 hypothetical protein [Candidatus Eisenbacteria bacterium]
ALRRAGIAQITQFVWDRGAVGMRENPAGMRAVVYGGLGLTALAWGIDLLLGYGIGWVDISSLILFQGLWISGITAALLLNVSFLATLDGEMKGSLGAANLISLARVGLLPTLSSAILRERWTEAILFYVVLALSDVADGIIARRSKGETRLGFILDPVADVLFHLVVFLSLHARGWIGTVTIALVLARYALLLAGSVVLLYVRGRIWIKPTPFGRATGVIFGAATAYLLLAALLGWTGPTVRIADWVIAALFAAGLIHVMIIGWINFRRPRRVGYGDWRSWGLPLGRSRGRPRKEDES